MKIIKEFMRDIKKKLKIIIEFRNEWRRREEKWEKRSKEKDKMEKVIKGNGVDRGIQEKIKIRSIKKTKEKKQYYNKEWEVPRKDALKTMIEEMLRT